MSTLELVPQEQPELDAKVGAIVEQAKAVEVVDERSANKASVVLGGIAELRRKIKDVFGPLKKKAHDAHKAIVAAEADQLAPVAEAERIIKGRLGAWTDAERRRRDDEARAARAIAEKAAQDERLNMAIELEDAGLSDLAEITLDQPVLPAVAIPQKVEIQGARMSTIYSARVSDKLALVRHVAAHPELLNFLSENMTAINSQARSMRDGFTLPGCELVKSTSVASRR